VLIPGVAFDTFVAHIDEQDPVATPSPATVHPDGVERDVLTGCYLSSFFLLPFCVVVIVGRHGDGSVTDGWTGIAPIAGQLP
jgi:hypothetical protein